jgi:RES domain-containing protein
LAALELLVHCDRRTLPDDLIQLEFEISDKLTVEELEATALPKNWQSHPAPSRLQRLGDDWLDAGTSAVLQVPSAVIPEESNFLLNPTHPGIRKIQLVSMGAFKYDSRLRK